MPSSLLHLLQQPLDVLDEFGIRLFLRLAGDTQLAFVLDSERRVRSPKILRMSANALRD